jgi:hypothetical protein
MKGMTMLDPAKIDLAKIDLASLSEALEDHSDETAWWFDPATGEVEPWSVGLSSGEDEVAPEDRGQVRIEPLPSSDGYGDMEEFIELVGDRRARQLLRRAIEGRGAFRRFKDALLEYPELRTAWFAFHDVRGERRTLQWLADQGFVERSVADAEIARRTDPDLPEHDGDPDPDAIAHAVADDLAALYGSRLQSVVLFGSWAREDAHPDSDIDLLIVLDRADSPWEELRRMEPILWKHSYANDTVVSGTPVADADLRAGRWPLLHRAQEEGRKIA